MSKLKNIPNVAPFALYNFMKQEKISPDIHFRRASTKHSVTNKKINRAIELGINVPAFEEDFGLVLDPSRTSAWPAGGLNGHLCVPIGFNNIDRPDLHTPSYFGVREFNMSGFTTNHSYLRAQSMERITGVPYSISLFIKPNSLLRGTDFQIRWLLNASNVGTAYYFDFKTGNHGPTEITAHDARGGMNEVGDGWWFVWAHFISQPGEDPYEPFDFCFYRTSQEMAASGPVFVSSASVTTWAGRPTPIPAHGNQITRASEFIEFQLSGSAKNTFIMLHDKSYMVRRLHRDSNSPELPVQINSECTVFQVVGNSIRVFNEGVFSQQINNYSLAPDPENSAKSVLRLAPWEQVAVKSIHHYDGDLSDSEVATLCNFLMGRNY